MRGEMTLRALALLEQASYTSVDFFVAAFIKSSKADYRALRNFVPVSHPTISGRLLAKRREAQRLQTLLSRLQKAGLVRKTQSEDQSMLHLTREGKRRLSQLRKMPSRELPRGRYAVKKGKHFTIVSYDIPEREKHKRNWLRSVLKRHDFHMLHRSAWAGMVKLPDVFVKDLKNLDLLDYVEILSVSNEGTLRKIS